jgi:hypothetical protein
VAPPVFKTGLAGNTLAGRFDSFPPPPIFVGFVAYPSDAKVSQPQGAGT